MSQPPPAHTHTHTTHPSSLPPTSTRNSKLWDFVTERCFSRSAFLGFDHIGSSTPPPLPSLETTERSSTSSLSSSSSSSSSLSLAFLFLSLVGSPRRNIFVCFLTIKVFFSLSLLLFYYTVTPFVFFCSLVVFAVDIHASHKHTRFVTSLEKQTREKIRQSEKTKPKKHTFLCPSSHIPSASASVQPSLSYANQACSSFPAFPPSPLPPPRPLLLRPDATSCCNAPRKMPKVCAVSHL